MRRFIGKEGWETNRRRGWVAAGFILLAWSLGAVHPLAAPEGRPVWGDSPTKAGGIVELRGRLVRLAAGANGSEVAGTKAEPSQTWGFKSLGGTVYRIVRNRFSEALFVEPRLRKEELLLKGTVRPDGPSLEVTRILSLRNGQVYDVFYFCPVCHIETVAPGICECCQGPVQLVEKPLRSDEDRP